MSRKSAREALATRLADGTSASAHARAPRQINAPEFGIVEFDQTPSTYGFALYDYVATVRCLVSGDIEHALDRLDELMDEIEPALEADPTLGGNADHAVLRRIRGDTEAIYEIQGAFYYGLDAEIDITGA